MVTRSCSIERKPLSIVAVWVCPDVDYDPNLAADQDSQQWGMSGQDPHLALDGARADLPGFALPDLAICGDKLNLQLTQRDPPLAYVYRESNRRRCVA